jgi:hypothetical protein
MIPQRRELVQACLGEVELLRVADAIVDLEPTLGRALLRRRDQHRGEVDSRHLRAALGCELRDRAGPAREVEQLVARPGREPLGDDVLDVRDRLADSLVRPVPPHHALALFQLLESHLELPLGLTSGG